MSRHGGETDEALRAELKRMLAKRQWPLSIRGLAARLNVSPHTVDRVLNKGSTCRDSTWEVVLERMDADLEERKTIYDIRLDQLFAS